MTESTGRSGYFLSLGQHGFHRLHYLEHGEAGNPNVLVCTHGLTRNAHDFDHLAQRLAGKYRVVAWDVAGRGGSDWLRQSADYGYPLYVRDAAALIAHLGAERISWIGTSMGGLIGMMLAAQPGTPIERLVLNDIGPFVPADALQRIVAYVGVQQRFRNLDEVEQYLRTVHAPFGTLTPIQWRHLAEHSSVPDGDGFRLHYDPAIAEPLSNQEIVDLDLWAVWDLLACNVLVLRGAESDVLTADTVSRMAERGPQVQCLEFGGTGHAPAMMSDDQIEPIVGWLGRSS